MLSERARSPSPSARKLRPPEPRILAPGESETHEAWITAQERQMRFAERSRHWTPAVPPRRQWPVDGRVDTGRPRSAPQMSNRKKRPEDEADVPSTPAPSYRGTPAPSSRSRKKRPEEESAVPFTPAAASLRLHGASTLSRAHRLTLPPPPVAPLSVLATPAASSRGALVAGSSPAPSEAAAGWSARGTPASSSRSTPRHLLQASHLSTPKDLPWNQPKAPPPEDDSLEALWAGFSGWFSDAFQEQAAKGKPRRKNRPSQPRPAWEDPGRKPAPLTGPTGPHAIANHRRMVKPWEQQDDEGDRKFEKYLDDRKLIRHKVTKSPCGRSHPSPERRVEIREADVLNRIERFAGEARAKLMQSDREREQLGGYITEMSSRQPATEGWIQSQAWSEALRYYPKGRAAHDESDQHGDSVVALSGQTHTVVNAPTEHGGAAGHLEAEVRNRNNVNPPEPDWRPDQSHRVWAPKMVRPTMTRKLERTVETLLSAAPTPRMMRAMSIAGYPHKHLSGSSKMAPGSRTDAFLLSSKRGTRMPIRLEVRI